MPRNVRKNYNIFFNGESFAGQTEEFNPPKLTLLTEEFRGGGMHGAVELTMGHEKLESDLTLISVDRSVLASWRITEGGLIGVTAREALESSDGNIAPLIHTMRVKVKEIDQGTVKAGEKGSVKITMAVSYYKLQHGAVVVQEIDVENGVHRANGVDLTAAMNAALGR